MRIAFCCLSGLLLLCGQQVQSQDANYWNSGYSAGGYIMPGAVVANNKDSGVLFYNPALLVKSKILLLSANATIYHINRINIKDGAGKGYDLVSNASGSVPLMVAGNVKLPFKKSVVIAYGIIQPEGFVYNVTQRRDDSANVLDDSYSRGNELFIGQYLNQNSSHETYVVASAGFEIAKGFSGGISLQGLYRTQTINSSYYARALTNPALSAPFQLASTDVSYYVDYAYFGLLAKIGFAWDYETHHAGILFTAPNIKLGGSGTLLCDNALSNIVVEPGTPPISLLANTRQKSLHPTWKTPFSVAFGYTQDFENWQFYASAEYFAPIKKYAVILPRKEFFIRGDTAQTNDLTPDLLQLQDERKNVFNWSLGANYHLTQAWSLYTTFRSNYSYADRNRLNNEQNISSFWQNTSYWNLYNVQAGVNIKRESFNLRAGLYFNFGGTDLFQQDINLSNAADKNLLLGDITNVTARYTAFGVMLSYIHNF